MREKGRDEEDREGGEREWRGSLLLVVPLPFSPETSSSAHDWQPLAQEPPEMQGYLCDC